MNDTSQLTDKHYQSFINEFNDHDFFLHLADYIKYLFENQQIKPLLNNLLGQKADEYKKLDSYYEKAYEELDNSKKRLLEIIQENDLTTDRILELLEKWEQLGITYFVAFPVNEKSEILFEIAKIITQAGKGELLKEFINPKPFYLNIYGDYIFSNSLIDFNNCKAAIKEKTVVEIWGVLYNLLAAEKAIHFYEPLDNRLLEIPQDGRPYWQKIDEGVDMLHLVYEWRQINNDGQVRWPNGGRPFWFKADKFKLFVTRFHNYLLKELAKQENFNNQTNLEFDCNESILYFQNKEILISKEKDSNPHALLKVVFKDKNKTWDYDEIFAELDSSEYISKKHKGKIYNAAYKVNEKIAAETTIKDFLDFTMKQVSINKKYL